MSKNLLILYLLVCVCQYISTVDSDEDQDSGQSSTEITVVTSSGNKFHMVLIPLDALGNILSNIRVLLYNVLSMTATLLMSICQALRVFLFSLFNALEVFGGNLMSDLGGGGNIMKM